MFTSTPTEVAAATAAPVANGLMVEPRTPVPAPSRTVAAPTIGSKPAAIIVAASRM